MRLVRIEAERFGRIDSRTLGDLSPKLTVVVGPNEAGKSSLTALVRHVLYGFPTPADTRENPYLSASGGKRQGRLVFADDDGEWVVERTEGPRGGPVTVRVLSGRPREGLVDQLTRGVSRAAYRVVFGFGLAEMQQIEQLKGKDDDLMSRLYAAGAGLTVSPPDMRAKLAERMDLLWKKGGSAPAINRARAARIEVRSEVRRLEGEADALRSDTEHLIEVDERLAIARGERTKTQARCESLARTVSEAERLLAESAQSKARAQAVALDASEARRTADAVATDDDAVCAADAVHALAAESSTFRERLTSLFELRAKLVTVELRLRTALSEAGWSEDQALAAAADAGIASEIEAARAALADLKARADLTAEARDRAVAEAEGAAASGGAIPGPVRVWSPSGLALAGLGVAGLVAGLALGQTALAMFAVVVAIAGAMLAFVGTQPTAGGADAAQARARVATAEAAAQSARRALDERTAAWAERVRAWGLGSGSEEPAAVAARLQAARDVRAADNDRTGVREATGRDERLVDAYVERVRAAVAPLLGDEAGDVTSDRCLELVGRAVARVESAVEEDRARIDALAAAERLEHEAEAARAAADASAGLAATELASVGIADGGLEEARRLSAEVRLEAEDALQAFDELTTEAATLRTRIDAVGREDRLASLRLEDETFGELIAADVREYTVLALASRLLARAQARYERERQPEVVKRAEAAFSRMTNGRYPHLAIPLGKEDIEVFSTSAAAAGTDKLSRGTAEQLYLALRIGLVDQLGDVGGGLPVLMDDVLVNFSPDRLQPAAEAVAELADKRQVVFFTCHPAMADLLCRVAPHAVRIELEGPAAQG
jgi:uncharacterized protein YhaN